MTPQKGDTAVLRSDHVAARIKDQLDSRGLSQHWLAERTGISERSISYWMRGRMRPGLASTERVAQALGVRPGWLAFGEELHG